MTGYANSPAGYMNPVAVDKIQHPDYDAKAAENTTMRLVQYLYPVVKNCTEMLESLCKETDVQVPTDLADNMEFLKTVYNTQIDWHPRTMYGDEAAEELNARLTLHEEWATDDNAHHSALNWQNPYGDNGQLQQAPAVTQQNPYGQQMNPYGQQQMNPYGQQMPMQPAWAYAPATTSQSAGQGGRPQRQQRRLSLVRCRGRSWKSSATTPNTSIPTWALSSRTSTESARQDTCRSSWSVHTRWMAYKYRVTSRSHSWAK